MGKFLTTLLNYSIRIENPCLYQTKAEVVQSVVRNHLSMVDCAVSCWKALRVLGRYKHCGFCIPCLVRRIAIETNGVCLPEYRRDLFGQDVGALDPNDEGKRNLIELAEFVKLFEQGTSQAALEEIYPELINRHINASDAVAMYRRFAAEARAIFDRYPLISALMR
jgi:hypothetical protein